MKIFFIAFLSSTFLICSAHASSPGAEPITQNTACRAGVLAPNQISGHLLQKTAYEPDSVVSAPSTACCDVVCTRMLSTTRLPMQHEPGRT